MINNRGNCFYRHYWKVSAHNTTHSEIIHAIIAAGGAASGWRAELTPPCTATATCPCLWASTRPTCKKTCALSTWRIPASPRSSQSGASTGAASGLLLRSSLCFLFRFMLVSKIKLGKKLSVHMLRLKYVSQSVNDITICQKQCELPLWPWRNPSLSPSPLHSGYTPVIVTGTNLDIIQTPLIRAKYNNHETLNVS